jgi:hypothetical protein
MVWGKAAGLVVFILVWTTRVLAVGVPPPVDLVRVVKSERRLELLSKGVVVRTYGIALGGDPVGAKRREGDGRTPEGSYVLDWRNPDSVAYKSIHISYPVGRTAPRPGWRVLIPVAGS